MLSPLIVYPVLTTSPSSPFLPREFAKEKDRVESRAAFLHKKMVQRLDLEIDGYMNWICKAGKKERTTSKKEKEGKELLTLNFPYFVPAFRGSF